MASIDRKKAMNMEIAERLVAMRREAGLSQEELAGRLELSRQAISKWERGESAPDMGNLVALADLYEVSLDELIRGKAPEPAAAPEASEVEKVDVTINTYINDEKTKPAGAADAAVVVETATGTAAAAAPEPVTSASSSAATAAASAPGQTQACPPPPQTPPVYAVPAPAAAPAPAPAPQPASEVWMTFPYPLFIVLLYLVLGFVFGLWHPGWIIFLTIPFFYWIVHVVKTDPNYIATHPPVDSNQAR